MIETTHIRLEKAAEMLGTDADTLLVAAAERRITLYGILNERPKSELVVYTTNSDGRVTQSVKDESGGHFVFVPISFVGAGRILQGKDPIVFRLSDVIDEGNTREFFQWAGTGVELPRVSRNLVYLKRADVEAICDQGKMPDAGSVKEPSYPLDRAHVSNALALVNQAARQWWANASQDDPATHPKNADVAAWLIDRGLSPTQAQSAARIIRPEWAHNGRKPDA